MLTPEERAREACQATIEHLSASAEQLEAEARAMRKRCVQIRNAFVEGRFWELKTIIGAEDVEKLCQEHPTDLHAFWAERTWKP
jgi:hypothetical protein